MCLHILNMLRAAIEGGTLEARIEALEARISERGGVRPGKRRRRTAAVEAKECPA